MIKPVCTYRIPLWGTTYWGPIYVAISHINKLEWLQQKILRTIVNALWYVRNENIRRDLKIPTVKEEIGRYAEKCQGHSNRLAVETSKTLIERRLKRKHPTHLTKEIKQSNSKMVSRWRQPSTCYLAIKLEKSTECPAGQIVKYKLNNKKEFPGNEAASEKTLFLFLDLFRAIESR